MREQGAWYVSERRGPAKAKASCPYLRRGPDEFDAWAVFNSTVRSMKYLEVFRESLPDSADYHSNAMAGGLGLR